jgi:hypothetical protein
LSPPRHRTFAAERARVASSLPVDEVIEVVDTVIVRPGPEPTAV